MDGSALDEIIDKLIEVDQAERLASDQTESLTTVNHNN